MSSSSTRLRCSTAFRARTSDSGASSSGPMEAPNEGIVILNVETTLLMIPNSEANSEAPEAYVVVAMFLDWTGVSLCDR